MTSIPGPNRSNDGLMLAPWVIWMRLPIMMAEAMNPAVTSRRETSRAMTEKASAGIESLASLQMAMLLAPVQVWVDMLGGKAPGMAISRLYRTAQRDAIKPYTRRVAANHRRLSSRK